jgi:hypothetical protein
MKLGLIKRKTGPNNRGNTNAVRHGAFAQLSMQGLDGRSKLARAFHSVVNGLTSELGEPTTQEKLLILQIAFKALKCRLAEEAMLNDANPSSGLETKYVCWTNSIRLDLQALGLQRRQKQVLDLKSYIEEVKE